MKRKNNNEAENKIVGRSYNKMINLIIYRQTMSTVLTNNVTGAGITVIRFATILIFKFKTPLRLKTN